jgi:hypothetical protein
MYPKKLKIPSITYLIVYPPTKKQDKLKIQVVNIIILLKNIDAHYLGS